MSSDTSTNKKDALPEEEDAVLTDETVSEEVTAGGESDTETPETESASPAEGAPEAPLDAPTEEPALEGQQNDSTNKLKLSGLIVLVALVAAAGIWFALQNGNGVASIDEDKVLATVNGIEITEGERQERLQQIDSAAEQQGRPPLSTDPMVREQVLDELVNLHLLEQTAREQGLEVTEDEIDEQLTTLEGLFGGAEGFQDQVNTLGLTEESLRTNITRELLITKYIESVVPEEELAVTEEEVRDVYENFVAQSDDAPPFEEIRPQIEQQLEQQKSSLAVQELITELRSEADVELHTTQ